MNESQLDILVRETLSPRGSHLLSFHELALRILGDKAEPADTESLRVRLEHLERKGVVVRARGEKFSLIEFTNFRAGTLVIRGEGKGFVLSREKGGSDLLVSKEGLATALDGDLVLARVEKPKAGKARGGGEGRGRDPRFRETGVVVKILVRKRDTVIGKIVRGTDGTVIVPFDTKVNAIFRVAAGKDLGAPDGIFVEAKIVSWPDERRIALAEVVGTIGFEGDPGVDVEVIAYKHNLPRQFSEGALTEAEQADGRIAGDERASRSDFTKRFIVTIDGETARDFDDAIEAEELPGGGFRIGIHIADVSHYVRPGSALDADALDRGTSVYFPDRAIPMLPERLSNDLCSLRPDEERRTVSAILTLDSTGETIGAEFARSLIRSRARLTYTQVGAFLDTSVRDTSAVPPEVRPMLKTAARAAKLLGTRRDRRGSLDFDLPDANVVLGETGDVVAIVKAVRNEAHRLIEEFMLAANEAVARHLRLLPTPALYRVHDRPDERRLSDLRAILEPLGFDIPDADEEVTPSIFQKILAQAEGLPEERFVSDLVLRSQKKALYSEECRGHYALAARDYCHFTSPIRRYPDLLVHRALVEWIALRRPPEAEEAAGRQAWMAEAGPHCSDRERRAETAERESVAWKKFVFLSKRVGEEFDAYVSAVVPFGLFIVLADLLVDGLVPIDTLGDEYFNFEEGSHRLVGAQTGLVYRLGDPLRVKLVKADHERRVLEFVVAGGSNERKGGRRSPPPEAGRPRSRRPGPSGRSGRPAPKGRPARPTPAPAGRTAPPGFPGRSDKPRGGTRKRR